MLATTLTNEQGAFLLQWNGEPGTFLLVQSVSFQPFRKRRLGKGSLFATLYYQQIQNPIQRVNKVFNDTILNWVFTNAGRALQWGLEANTTLQLNKVWQSLLGGNVYRYRINGGILGGAIPVSNQSWVFSINTTHTLALPRSWTVQLTVNYLSARATAEGEDGYFFTKHLSVKKTTPNKRWRFQAQWLNMDGRMGIANRQRITTYGAFFTATNYIYEPDQLQLSVSFNLRKKDRKISLPQSEIEEKEF